MAQPLHHPRLVLGWLPAGATHHGLLELVRLDTAHEEGLAGTQCAHQQLQRPLELAAECGRALPGLRALGGWTTEMGGADLRPSTLPEGKLEGRAVGSGPKGELPRKVGWPSNWGYLVTLLVWAWSSDPSCTPSGDHPGT